MKKDICPESDMPSDLLIANVSNMGNKVVFKLNTFRKRLNLNTETSLERRMKQSHLTIGNFWSQVSR